MSLNLTPEDRKQYTSEYVLSLEKANIVYRKQRWYSLVSGLIILTLGILRIFNFGTGFTTYFVLISACMVLFITAIKWNLPKHRYEKAKAIRELLDAEEAEK